MRARKTEAKEDYHGDHRHLQDDRQQRVRALYLPNEWTDDPARLKAAHVPSDVGFATEPQIARRMVARAVAAKVPFSFAAADSVYGTGEIETLLRKAGKGYDLGFLQSRVRSWGKQQPVAGTASAIAQSLPKKAWPRSASGEGTKGPRWPVVRRFAGRVGLLTPS
ncbi:SRSO17 transposase [Bradyrhizobium yuanmingense]